VWPDFALRAATGKLLRLAAASADVRPIHYDTSGLVWYWPGMDPTGIDREDLRNLLEEIGRMRMPFGKFGPKEYPPRGVPIVDLPAEYLAWFRERGFPQGRLGELLETVFEIKQNGADGVFEPIRQANGGRIRLRRERPKEFDFGEE